jgi:hypothetical protein
MIKVWTDTTNQWSVRQIVKWQAIDRVKIDKIASNANRPKAPTIYYFSSKKLPKDFYLNYKKYILDDNDRVILGPQSFEKISTLE